MWRFFYHLVAVVAAAGSTLAQTSPQGPHPFAGKTCSARGDSASSTGRTGAGKYDFDFSRTGALALMWTGDSGRVVALDLAYSGIEDKFLVFKTRGGGTAHIDAKEWSGTVRVGTVVSQFQKMTCN